jgi:hypothetical protein
MRQLRPGSTTPRPLRHHDRSIAIATIVALVALLAWTYLTRPEPAPQRKVVAPAAPTCVQLRERSGSEPVGTCRTATALLTAGPQERPLRIDDLTVDVRSARLTLASTRSGRRRDRARLTVLVTFVNTGDDSVAVDRSALSLVVAGRPGRGGGAALRPERLRLDTPIPPGARRSGIVRFETAGATSDGLERSGRADLGLRVRPDRVGVVRLRLEPTPAT